MYNDFKGGKRLLIFQPGDLSIPERWEAIFFQSSYFCKKKKTFTQWPLLRAAVG